MACDSQATRWSAPTQISHLKIIKRGDFLLGLSGRADALDLLHNDKSWSPKKGQDIYAIFASMKKVFKNNGILHEENGITTANVDGVAALHGKLYTVSNSMVPVGHNDKLLATGSGMDVAMGAMVAVNLRALPARALVRTAVAVASKVDIYTGGKIHVKSVNI